MTLDPMDAVITWVDGNDPAHIEKRAPFVADKTAPGAAATRFDSMDEVVYCVLSIMKHAPFFANIFIVTDAQTPPVFEAVEKYFPEQLHKIKVVDHSEIFKGHEAALPTFNSDSIVSGLHRIPDLSDRFVFFNDDFFLIQDVSAADFFEGDKPVLYGGWMGRSLDFIEGLRARLDTLRKIPKAHRRLSSKRRIMAAARLAGSNGRTFIATHAPYAMRKNTLAGFENSYPEIWANNLSYKFRAAEQFVPEALANHLEFAKNNAVVKDRSALVYIRADHADLSKVHKKLEQANTDENAKFMCIQSLDQAESDAQTLILEWLDARFKQPSNQTPAP